LLQGVGYGVVAIVVVLLLASKSEARPSSLTERVEEFGERAIESEGLKAGRGME